MSDISFSVTLIEKKKQKQTNITLKFTLHENNECLSSVFGLANIFKGWMRSYWAFRIGDLVALITATYQPLQFHIKSFP